MRQQRTFLTTLLAIQAVAIILIGQQAWAASSTTGTYVSPPIGTPYVSKFLTFIPTNQVVPDGTSITYSFAGSADNYATWSSEIASQKIDLTTYSQLANSHFLEVRITMNGTANISPSLTGFQVTYDTTVETPSTSTTTPAPAATTQTTPAPAPTTQATTTVPVTSSPSATATATTSATHTPTASSPSPTPTRSTTATTPRPAGTSHVVTLADTQKVTASSKVPVSTLVSTGSNLWINLLIALLLSAATTWWFLLRHLHAMKQGDSLSE